MNEERRRTASFRLTREERAAVELATARSGLEFVSQWLRRVVLDRLEEELGAEIVKADETDERREP